MDFDKYSSMKISDLEIKVALFMQVLTDGFIANKGLQYLIDKASELLGRPLALYDSSFKVLAASADADSILEYEYGDDGNRYICGDSIALLPAKNEHEEKKTVWYFSRDDMPLLKGILIASVKIDVIEVASLVVGETGIAFLDLDYMLVEKLRGLLSAQLQRSILLNLDNNQNPSYILADLIEGRVTDQTISRDKKTSLKWLRSDFLYILVVCSSPQEAFDRKVSVVYQTLKSYIPAEQRIIYNSGIVAIIDENLYKALFNSKDGAFTRFIEENNLYVGISRKFSILSDAKKQYQYALDALNVGQKRGLHCAFFDDCILHIVSGLISARYDPMDICHPAVIALMNYDNENGSSLLNTLKQYIYFTSAPGEAARVLNIHRNTLFYRLGKIKELTGITFDNGDEKSQVYMSIKLLESTGTRPRQLEKTGVL